jgi:anti-sigma B factor antagonist
MADKTSNLIKEVQKKDDGTVVVLEGDVDLNQSSSLLAALTDVVNERPKRLMLDLNAVPYMDSSGLGTLVQVLRHVNTYKGKMVFFGLSSRVRSVFEITKLDKFFTICDTEEQAGKA